MGEGPGDILSFKTFFGFTGEYITSLLTLTSGYSFYPLCTLIKLYYTKSLSNQASSLALDWRIEFFSSWGPRIPALWFNNNLSYKFLKRQVRWSGIPISFRIFQFIVIHTVKGFGIVNKAEIDVFLELSCFFHDPADVGNLISGSFAFSKANKPCLL